MRLRLRILFVVWVAGPLAVLAVLGVRTARNEEGRARREVESLLLGRLEERAAELGGALASLERELLADTDNLPADAESLRALRRERPRLRRILVLDERGQLLFPPAFGPNAGPVSDDERRFVDETSDLWERGVLSHPARDEQTGLPAQKGWVPFPGGDGFGLIFWRQNKRESTGKTLGASVTSGRVAVAVSGAALLERMIAALPATLVPPVASSDYLARRSLPWPSSAPVAEGRVEERLALEDPSGQYAYQWGTFEPAPHSKPVVTLALPAPLGAWRLAYLGPGPRPGRTTMGMMAGLIALAVTIAGGGLWLYRENTRELRLAAERVSFVNQVSHELKTPLTNIRLYAELLDDHVDPDDGVGRQRLGVVVAESQRLGRLIHNILTFSRQEKGLLTLHHSATEGVVDDIVRDVIVQFTPGLQARGVPVVFEPGAPERVRLDADALSQMLGNMLGNVEKYAPGAAVSVRTTWQAPNATATIVIHDQGPGIPAGEAERIFQPFVRLGGAAHEGVPGTGIGLGLARDLARLHGGDLRLVPSTRGACFVLTLKTELVT